MTLCVAGKKLEAALNNCGGLEWGTREMEDARLHSAMSSSSLLYHVYVGHGCRIIIISVDLGNRYRFGICYCWIEEDEGKRDGESAGAMRWVIREMQQHGE